MTHLPLYIISSAFARNSRMLRFGIGRAARKLSGKRFGAGLEEISSRMAENVFGRYPSRGRARTVLLPAANRGKRETEHFCLQNVQFQTQPSAASEAVGNRTHLKSTKTRSLYAILSDAANRAPLAHHGQYAFPTRRAAPRAHRGVLKATRTGKRMWCIFNYTTKRRLCQPLFKKTDFF